jgi:hypothetical protein
MELSYCFVSLAVRKKKRRFGLFENRVLRKYLDTKERK